MAAKQDAYFNRLPVSETSEIAIITSILVYPESVLHLFREELSVNDFYFENHRQIFKSACAVQDRGIEVDLVSVVNDLEARGVLKQVGGSAEIAKFGAVYPISFNPTVDAKAVKDAATKRALLMEFEKAKQTLCGSVSDADETISEALAGINAIADSRDTTKALSVGAIGEQRLAVYAERMKTRHMITGIPSGLGGLDKCLLGFQDNDLIVLAARPGVGKTAITTNIIVNAAKAGFDVLFFSLEMSAGQIYDRMIAREMRQDSRGLVAGQIDDFHAVERAASAINRLPITIDDNPAATVHQIRARAKRFAQKTSGKFLVVVDYLQRVKVSNPAEKRYLSVAEIASGLKNLARELSIPVLALAQLNRNLDQRKSPEPILSDLRESGDIEQEADIVAFLHQPPGQPETQEVFEQRLIVAKHRNGPKGVIPLLFFATMQDYREGRLESDDTGPQPSPDYYERLTGDL